MPASAKQPTDRRTALVLQGGAALGAYEAGVLKALLAAGRRCEIVTGCSIGALMAAIFVASRGDPGAALEDMWRRFAMPTNPFVPNLFAHSLPLPSSLYRPNPQYFAWPTLATHLYEIGPLLAALEEWVDFERLNASPTEVIVTAVEVKTGKLAEFSNRQGLTARHIAASASLPPIFPPLAVDGGEYWDGGLIANAPLRPALNAIEAHNRKSRAERWELIVVDLFSPTPDAPRDMTDVIQRAFELVFFGKFQSDLKLYQLMDAQLDLLEAVDRALPASSAVRKHPAYLKLKRHRRVDTLTLIRPRRPQDLGGPADFAPPTIAARIEMGEEDGRAALNPPARATRRRG